MQGKGFLIYAEGEHYVKQAYLAALSIRASGNEFPVSLVTNNTLNAKQRAIFDQIIDIPWYVESNTVLKTENRWKMYHASPYYETIVLDSDTLVLQNLHSFWNFLNNYNIYFPTRVFTYRKEPVQSDYYRKAFAANSLPNFYNCVHYFKKSDWSKQFFEWVQTVSDNWELFYGKFCAEYYPKEPSMDITTAIASKILDCDLEISNQKQTAPEIVHLKPQVQNWRMPKNRWQNKVGVYLTEDLQLKIGNHRQDSVIHYTEKDFCTDDKIAKYEKQLQCL